METNPSLRLLLDASFEAYAKPGAVDAVVALALCPKRKFQSGREALTVRLADIVESPETEGDKQMSIELPSAIAVYFAKDKKADATETSECFTQEATVIDEGNTYTGRDAIRKWIANASTKYTYTVEPFSIEEKGNKTIVSSHLVGNFPGSPVDLRYFFVIDGDKIAELEIIV